MILVGSPFLEIFEHFFFFSGDDFLQFYVFCGCWESIICLERFSLATESHDLEMPPNP